jgi:hypothetical protein
MSRDRVVGGSRVNVARVDNGLDAPAEIPACKLLRRDGVADKSKKVDHRRQDLIREAIQVLASRAGVRATEASRHMPGLFEDPDRRDHAVLRFVFFEKGSSI